MSGISLEIGSLTFGFNIRFAEKGCGIFLVCSSIGVLSLLNILFGGINLNFRSWNLLAVEKSRVFHELGSLTLTFEFLSVKCSSIFPVHFGVFVCNLNLILNSLKIISNRISNSDLFYFVLSAIELGCIVSIHAWSIRAITIKEFLLCSLEWTISLHFGWNYILLFLRHSACVVELVIIYFFSFSIGHTIERTSVSFEGRLLMLGLFV